MPRLLYMVPCSHAIIGQDGTISIISVVERMTVPAPVPPGARAQQSIFVVAHFWRDAGDDEREFELRMQSILPSGRVAREKVAPPFRMNEIGHRYLIKVPEFRL